MEDQNICGAENQMLRHAISLEDLYNYAAGLEGSIGYALRELRNQTGSTEEQQKSILGIKDDADWFHLQGKFIPPLSSFNSSLERIAKKCNIDNIEILQQMLTVANSNRVQASNIDGQDCWCL